MKPITRWIIRKVLQWDKSVHQEVRQNILDAMEFKTRETVTALGAARLLGCTRPTLRRYVSKGWIREVYITRNHRMYDRRDIEKLLQYGPPTKV